MEMKNLDIKTRTEIHNSTKLTLRKYQKGLRTGKLPINTFVENILKSKNPPKWLKENPNLKTDESFKKSYIEYIKKIVLKYKELEMLYKIQDKTGMPTSKDKRANVKQQAKLKKLLNQKGYTLTIPSKYLTEKEINYMLDYLKTGSIPLGHERVYNYIKSSH
ncbi:hypothetical protein [Tepidibacter formicigenes]|uniref:Uncharacterized protein n=1 Tax=Tepidibacter formicigenes DSM 15518 TaxID=1123349 RepID=A0A1M6P4W4_9FIRM|nr:hypothetical protein [Tepidibacter formicigenes]SHK02942.1 hypothetical protein SAMN02744037_01460 [Tepidibacter formicigenes DSM 15518]